MASINLSKACNSDHHASQHKCWLLLHARRHPFIVNRISQSRVHYELSLYLLVAVDLSPSQMRSFTKCIACSSNIIRGYCDMRCILFLTGGGRGRVSPVVRCDCIRCVRAKLIFSANCCSSMRS